MKRSEAVALRKIIEQAVQSLDDGTGIQAVTLYPAWVSGREYALGDRIRREGGLWRCIQGHTAQSGWEPETVPALWERINESHAGTAEDPIPYGSGMALTAGLYYIQDGGVYLCIRDTGNPVYQPLAELLGIYVEKAA